MHITDPSTRDLLAEIDAALRLGRERHLDFREQAFDLLVRLRPLVEREVNRLDGGENRSIIQMQSGEGVIL